ncbi:hypothetical protein ACIQU5_17090 [Streptomyces sp. NPDC090306]|uniref:hypothetical protein n=1 Tax=Streptomyces sp. NPDC090306 TaxID=3365961 RepID=UPI00380D5CDE
MSDGGMSPLRNRYLAAGFIVLMYLMIGALAAALLVAGLSGSDMWGVVAAVAGGALGAGFGVWRIRSTPEDERGDGSTW